MEVPRKIGICILMIIPTFVGSGALWDLFHHNWLPILAWIIIMALCAGAIVTQKFSRVKTPGTGQPL